MNETKKKFELRTSIIRCVVVARIIQHLCYKLQPTLVYLDSNLSPKSTKLCKMQNNIFQSAGNLKWLLQDLLATYGYKKSDDQLSCFAKQIDILYHDIKLSDIDTDVDNIARNLKLEGVEEYYRLRLGNVRGGK